MPLTSCAPTFIELRDTLVSHEFACPLPAAAAFLASPVTAVPGLTCGSDGRNLWLRGHKEMAGATISDHAAAAVSLAQRAGRTTDQYIDLSSDPAHWFKFVASGAHTVAFGTDTLWGLPRILAHGGVDADQVAQVVAVLRADPDTDLPLMLAGGQVIASGDAQRLELTCLSNPAAVPAADPRAAPERARAAAAHLADLTGAALLSVSPGDEPGHWVATVVLGKRALCASFTLRGSVYSFEQRGRGPQGDLLVADGDVLVHRSGIVFRVASAG